MADLKTHHYELGIPVWSSTQVPGFQPSALATSLGKKKNHPNTLRDACTKHVFCLLSLPCTTETKSIKFTHGRWTYFFSWYSRTMCSKLFLTFQQALCCCTDHTCTTVSISKWENTPAAPISQPPFFFWGNSVPRFLLSPSCSNAHHSRHLQI